MPEGGCEDLTLTQDGLDARVVEPAASVPEQPVAQAEVQKPGEVKVPGGRIVQNKVADRLQSLKRNAKLWLLAGYS